MARIGNRYIDGDKLLDTIGEKNVGVRARLTRWLKRQPKAPVLVSRQGAAEILGISSPHMARIEDRLNPVAVEGSTRPVYVLAEIKELKKTIDNERKAKD